MSELLVSVRRVLTALLILVAFWFSYSHTAQWLRENGQAQGAEALALVPEVALMLVILTLVTTELDWIARLVLITAGTGSLAVTLAGNLSQASPGPAGKAAALIAPLGSALFFILEVRSIVAEIKTAGQSPIGGQTRQTQGSPEPQLRDQDQPRMGQTIQINNTVQVAQLDQHGEPAQGPAGPVQVQHPAEPVEVQVVQEPAKVSRSTELVHAAKVSRPRTSTAQITADGARWSPERTAAQQWAAAQTNWPTATELRAQFPELGLSTAKRVKPVPAGTGQVGQVDHKGSDSGQNGEQGL